MSINVNNILDINELPKECIEACSAIGRVDEAVSFWREKLGFTVDRNKAIGTLASYGAWERSELEDTSDDDLAEIVLWLACGDFNEQLKWEEENPDKDPMDSSHGHSVFCLE